jgi:hypothetical protein
LTNLQSKKELRIGAGRRGDDRSIRLNNLNLYKIVHSKAVLVGLPRVSWI